jgi:hypothetical protein
MIWYIVLCVVIGSIAWLLWRLWKSYAFNSLTGLHRIPIEHSEYEGLYGIVSYKARSHMWDIEFIGIDAGSDLWEKLSDTDKAIIQVRINRFLCDARSRKGVPY